jgi:hypothetical protein
MNLLSHRRKTFQLLPAKATVLLLHRLGTIHRDAGSGPIAQVIPDIEKRSVLPSDLRLLRGQPGENRRECLGDVDRHVARLASGTLLGIGRAEGNDHRGRHHSRKQSSVLHKRHGVLLERKRDS